MTKDLSREYNIQQERRKLVLQEGPCGHCGVVVEFRIPEGGGGLSYNHSLQDIEDNKAWTAIDHQFLIGICRRKDCGKPTVLYRTLTAHGHEFANDSPDEEERIEILFPRGAGRRTNLPLAVPERLRDLYAEAARVEYISPTSAAHLCGRMLEFSLREKLGTKKGMLAELIEAFQQSENPPPALADMMNTVRGFRNIASHAGEDDSGGLVTVDSTEAAYLLDVIPQLFHFIYIQPQRANQMMARLNAKKSGKDPGPVESAAFVISPAPPEPTPLANSSVPWDASDDDLPF